MADEFKKKIDMLRGNGYSFDWKREIYYSKETRKIFSREALEDHDLQWLEGCLSAPNHPSEWNFYFNSPPSEAVRSNLTHILSQHAAS